MKLTSFFKKRYRIFFLDRMIWEDESAYPVVEWTTWWLFGFWVRDNSVFSNLKEAVDYVFSLDKEYTNLEIIGYKGKTE